MGCPVWEPAAPLRRVVAWRSAPVRSAPSLLPAMRPVSVDLGCGHRLELDGSPVAPRGLGAAWPCPKCIGVRVGVRVGGANPRTARAADAVAATAVAAAPRFAFELLEAARSRRRAVAREELAEVTRERDSLRAELSRVRHAQAVDEASGRCPACGEAMAREKRR